MTIVIPSTREAVQVALADWLRQSPRWTAPYGVLTGKHAPEGRKTYRSVTFGIARILDAEVRIYSPTFLLLRSSRRGDAKFASLGDLLEHLSGTEFL